MAWTGSTARLPPLPVYIVSRVFDAVRHGDTEAERIVETLVADLAA